MSAKIHRYKKLGIWTAVITTVFFAFCFAMANSQEGIHQFGLWAWLIWGTGIFVLGAIWFIVISMPNE